MRLKNQSIIRRKRLRFLPQAPSKVHESLGKSKLCGLDDELHAPSAHELVDVRAIGEAHHAGERLRVAEEDRVEALAAERADCAGLYAEVEIAELAATPQERLHREKRIAFYEKHGFSRIPGLDYAIYGLPMHIYYRPIARKAPPDAPAAAQELRALYDAIFYRWERKMLRMRTE